VQSGDDTTQIPMEWGSTDLPPPLSAPLPPPPPVRRPLEEFFIRPEFSGQSACLPNLRLIRSGSHPLSNLRQTSLRWIAVAIAAAAVAQTGGSLFTALIAPTFAQKIEQARLNRVGIKVSAMNQAQQVYFLDHGSFSSALVSLDLGIASQGQYYDYQIQTHSRVRRRHSNAAPPEQQIVVSLALPREPGLPTVWGAIAAQGSDRITDSLICKKPAPPLDWSDLLRQQFQSAAIKRRSKPIVPIMTPRLECPVGFKPASLPVPF